MSLVRATLRIARSTDRMEDVAAFYMEGLGFEKLAAFEDHAGFDGVILEFTHERGRPSSAAPDPESLLVFYIPDADEWRAAVARLRSLGVKPVPSHNAYWDRSGLTFEDPDGFRVVLQNAAWGI